MRQRFSHLFMFQLFLWICLITINNNIHFCDAARALTGTKFANTTVYAGMILTDPTIAEVLGRDFHKVPQGVNGTARYNAEMRILHAKETAKQLPFAVDFWYDILYYFLFLIFLISFQVFYSCSTLSKPTNQRK